MQTLQSQWLLRKANRLLTVIGDTMWDQTCPSDVPSWLWHRTESSTSFFCARSPDEGQLAGIFVGNLEGSKARKRLRTLVGHLTAVAKFRVLPGSRVAQVRFVNACECRSLDGSKRKCVADKKFFVVHGAISRSDDVPSLF